MKACACLYVSECVLVYVCVHECLCVRVRAFVFSNVYSCVCAGVLSCVCACVYECVSLRVWACVFLCVCEKQPCVCVKQLLHHHHPPRCMCLFAVFKTKIAWHREFHLKQEPSEISYSKACKCHHHVLPCKGVVFILDLH